MDPITAFGLASNVIQVVDFSIKLVDIGYQIYKSKEGALLENSDTEAVAIDLQMLNAKLSQSLYQARQSVNSTQTLASSSSDPDEDDKALESLCSACHDIAEKLISRLRTLKVSHGGKHREWKSIRQALKTVWSRDELNAMAARLKTYRDQLNTRILVSLRERLKMMDAHQRERFDGLDQQTRKVMDALIGNRSVFTNDLEIQTKLLSMMIITQNEQTRQMLNTFITPRSVSPEPGSTGQAQLPEPETASTGFDGEAQSIHQLAAEGNMPSLRDFLRINPHMINSLNERGQTAMHVAASCGDLNLAKYLRRKGAELNADDDNGQTPLHCASIQLREPLVRFLLSEGADKRVEDDKGKTALDYAKDDFVISWMLRFGHSLEDRNPEKNDTALGYAAWAGNAEAVGHLLEQGANVEARNVYQYTALMDACRHGRIEVVKLLLKHGADKEARVGNEGWTPLLLGVVYRQIEVVQLMIAAGGNMETKSKHTGHTALCEALWKRHWEIARLLLNSGADIHSRDCFLYTPLHRAAMDGYVDDAILILDKGADINAQNKDGWSALTEACYLGFSNVVALLLSRGTAIDGPDHGLATPLYLAAQTGRTAIVSQLLAAGANPSAQNIDGWTPLEAAAWHGFDEVASLLLSAGADPNIPDNSGYTPLCKAAWAQRVAVARVLLENGAYIEAANKDDWTSLTEAAFYGAVEMIELLLDHGSNIEAPSQKFDFKDEGGFTPLMRAAERGHLAASEYLLSRGANVEARSSVHGWTPLFLAVGKKHEEIVRRLIQGGADIWAGDKSGRTPVMEAARVGGQGMVKMMKHEFEKAKGVL